MAFWSAVLPNLQPTGPRTAGNSLEPSAMAHSHASLALIVATVGGHSSEINSRHALATRSETLGSGCWLSAYILPPLSDPVRR